MVILRGTNSNGEHKFYNGKAGQAWLSDSESEGFPYSVNRARNRATDFNKMTAIHGFYFVAWDTETQKIATL